MAGESFRRICAVGVAALAAFAVTGCNRAKFIHATCTGHGGIASVTLDRSNAETVVGCRDGSTQEWSA